MDINFGSSSQLDLDIQLSLVEIDTNLLRCVGLLGTTHQMMTLC